MDTRHLEPYSKGHSHERVLQLACADRMAGTILGKPVNIQRNEQGAPFIPEIEQHLSISHTGDFMSMIITTNSHVALDIELADRNIDRLIPRYTDTRELALFDSLPLYKPAITVWGIKECLFKVAPVTGMLFKEHLIINEIRNKGDEIISRCLVDHPNLKCQVLVVSRIFGPLIVSYIDQHAYGHEPI